jgi:hypothetical protein
LKKFSRLSTQPVSDENGSVVGSGFLYKYKCIYLYRYTYIYILYILFGCRGAFPCDEKSRYLRSHLNVGDIVHFVLNIILLFTRQKLVCYM